MSPFALLFIVTVFVSFTEDVSMTCICIPEFLEGYRFNETIGEYFAVCAYTPRDVVGFVFGMINILLWLFAQVPQLIVNYRNKTAESLSCVFLTAWLIGDVTNLIGCLFTGQTQIQLYTSIYFMIMDIFILAQWVYYKRVNRAKKALNGDAVPAVETKEIASIEDKLEKGENVNQSQSSKRLYAVFFAVSIAMAKLATDISPETYSQAFDTLTSVSTVSALKSATPVSTTMLGSSIEDLSMALGLGQQGTDSLESSMSDVSTLPVSMTPGNVSAMNNVFNVQDDPAPNNQSECDFTTEVSHGVYVFGVVCSWVCASLYFYARIPQILHNYRRKSCEGLSLGLFLSSTMANFCYAISLLVPTTAVLSGNNFWATTFAYLFGCLCVNGLSLIILFQMWYYRHNKSPVDEAKAKGGQDSQRLTAHADDVLLDEVRNLPALGPTSSHYMEEGESGVSQVPARSLYSAPTIGIAGSVNAGIEEEEEDEEEKDKMNTEKDNSEVTGTVLAIARDGKEKA